MDKKFANEQNTNILYEILLQELKIDNRSIWISQITQIFKNNIIFFLENANFNNSLLELNKLFLKQTIIAINKLIPHLKNDKKINILPDDITFPHKIEDIRNIRKDLFDEEFNLKKMEFDSIMNLEKPNSINFSDDYKNEKIVNMEQLLFDKINERDLQFGITDEDKNIISENKLDNEDLIKINIDEIISNDNENKKKKVNFNSKEYDEIIPEIKNTIYEEQKSIELSTIINKVPDNVKVIDNSKNIISTQFLPMNEIVKKMNDFNSKIDHLTRLVEELSNLIKNKEG
jgi:hypothetical protein